VRSPETSRRLADLPAVVVDDAIAQRHPAGARLDHRARAFQQGALARSGRADEADHFAGGPADQRPADQPPTASAGSTFSEHAQHERE